MLTRWLACLGLLLMPALLVWAEVTPTVTPAAAPAENPPAETPDATTVTEARKLYEQVNALLIIRGLGLSQAQLGQLLPILQSLREERIDTRQMVARLWTNSGQNLQIALAAAVAGRTAPEALAPAQTALAKYEQVSAGLLQAHQAASLQLAAVLSPAQEALYEPLPQYLVREQAEALLGGAPSAQHYFVEQIDLLRALSLDEYRLVRYWEAQRLTSLLRPEEASGFAYQQARLLDAMDAAYLMDDDTYLYRRPNLPGEIAQYLGLQSAVRPTYFLWDQVALLLTSDQSAQVIQQLLGQTPEPVPEANAAAEGQAQQMEQAAGRARMLLLARTMALTAGQLAAMQPLVQQATTAGQAPGEAGKAAIGGRQAALHQMRDTLLAGPDLPPDLQEAWAALLQSLQEQRQTAVGTATETLVQTRDYLSADQSALVAWPPALAGGVSRQAQLEELRYVAAQMEVGLIFLDRRRTAAGQQAARGFMLPARTLNMLNEYVALDSPYRQQTEDYLRSMVRQARAVPPSGWEATWPRLVTELMVALGAVPGPGSIVSAAPAESWGEYFGALTDAEAPGTIKEVVAARGG